jgi:hypothetical protein
MTYWTATTPPAGAAAGLARLRASLAAVRPALGGFEGTTMPTAGIDVPNAQPRWLLELSP